MTLSVNTKLGAMIITAVIINPVNKSFQTYSFSLVIEAVPHLIRLG